MPDMNDGLPTIASLRNALNEGAYWSRRLEEMTADRDAWKRNAEHLEQQRDNAEQSEKTLADGNVRLTREIKEIRDESSRWRQLAQARETQVNAIIRKRDEAETKGATAFDDGYAKAAAEMHNEIGEVLQQCDDARTAVGTLGARMEAFGKLADRWEDGSQTYIDRNLVVTALRRAITTGEIGPVPFEAMTVTESEHPGTPTPRPDRTHARIADLARRHGALKAEFEMMREEITRRYKTEVEPLIGLLGELSSQAAPAPAISADQADAINTLLMTADTLDDWQRREGIGLDTMAEIESAFRRAVTRWREAGGRPQVQLP